MSATKRARPSQPAAATAPPQPKRQKVSSSSKAANGLGFLVDENARAGKLLSAELTNGVTAARVPKTKSAKAKVAVEADDEDERIESAAPAGKKSKLAKQVIDISSGEESSELEEDEDEDEEMQEAEAEPASTSRRKSRDETLPADAAAADSDAEEPAFGELLARHAGQIHVDGGADRALGAANPAPFDGLSSATLGTVLTQALKTNDKDQLETCFQVTDTERIRATIQRLHAPHVATLLQRIAERIYHRPGRTGSLFVWIQWSLVVHGGYLASHADVMRKLRALARVIRERARGLQPLLHLKGKIDMLSGQLELRRSLTASSALAHGGGDLDDEEGVVYIEGEDDWSSDEDIDADGRVKRKAITADEDEESEDGLELANGVEESEEEDDEEDSEEENEMLDLEAEETSDDEGSDAEESEGESLGEEDDDEDDEDDSEPEVVAKAPKMSGRRR